MAERVDCLYRVSTTKQVGHDEQNQADIPVQRKACREFAAKMGWTIVHEEQEKGVSGYKVSANDRDKLQLLKERTGSGAAAPPTAAGWSPAGYSTKGSMRSTSWKSMRMRPMWYA